MYFALARSAGRKGKIGRNIAGMERNDSGNVFRRLIHAQIGALEAHIMIAETLRHRAALVDDMLLDIYADHAAAAMEHLVQIVIMTKLR